MNELAADSRLELDFEEAERFLNLLDPTADIFVFQLFCEKGRQEKPRSPRLNTLRSKRFQTWLSEVSDEHYGIGVAINELAGRDRKNKFVTRIRAVWQDDDEGAGEPNLPASVVVETSSGKFHRYWLVDGVWPTDTAGKNDFRRVMAGIIAQRPGTDANPKDLCRALRLPGTFNQKAIHPEPFRARIVYPAPGVDPVRYTRSELIDAFAVEASPARDKSVDALRAFASEAGQHDIARIKSALAFIDPAPRSKWFDVGKALSYEFDGDEVGYRIWDDWSQGSDKYDVVEQRRAWDSLRQDHPDPTTLGTLFDLAKAGGWQGHTILPAASPCSPYQERLQINRRPNDLAQRAMKTVRQRLAKHGNSPDEKFYAGMEEVAKFFQAAADGDAVLGNDFWISSLAPGVGKTVTLTEAIRALMGMDEYKDIGVIVLLSQVEQINAFIDALGMNEQNYSVIVSEGYWDKVPTGNPVPNEARILLTTQQMLDARLGDGDGFASIRDFWFRGKPRQVRAWDEAIQPSNILRLPQMKIAKMYEALRTKSEGLYQDAKRVFDLLEVSEDRATLLMPDIEIHGVELETVLDDFEDDTDLRAVEALWKLSGRTVNVRRDKSGNVALSYQDVFPDDLGPLLILDASGPLRQVYADWSAERKNLRYLHSPRKSFRGLTIHYQDAGSGIDQYAHDNPSRFAIYDGFVAEVARFPETDRALIFCKKPSRKIAKIEEEMTTALQRRGLDTDRVQFRTWGLHTATNEFVDCSRVMLTSVLRYPASQNEGLGRAAKKLATEQALSDNDYLAIMHGEVMHNIYQAANRSRVRKLVGDSCPEACHLYVRFSSTGNGSLPPAILERMFPDAVIVDWEPVIELTGHQKRLAMLLIEQAAPEGVTLTKKECRERLGIASRSQFTPLVNGRLVEYLATEWGLTLETSNKQVRITGMPPASSSTGKRWEDYSYAF